LRIAPLRRAQADAMSSETQEDHATQGGGEVAATAAAVMELSVVLPCLNEAATLEVCINKAKAAIAGEGLAAEIVVADNGSSDGSREIARRAGVTLVEVATRGYGSALLAGIAAARGKYVIMADADDSYDLLQVGSFLRKLREGYDLVMGNRFQGNIAPGAMPHLHRYLGTPVLTLLAKVFFRTPCGDVNCGMRGFRKEAVAALGLRSLGMEFASEMLVKSSIFGLRIAEIPTDLSQDGRDKPPHLRTWRDGWRHLRFMLLYSPRWLFLYPGALLMLLGSLLSLWLLPGTRHIGRVGFDVSTLVYSTAMIFLGYQAVNFAVFTKVFAITAGYLPRDEKFNRLFRVITLETGLVVGAALFLLGLIISIFAVDFWRASGFGPLDPGKTLRLVMPGVIFLTLGCQTIFSSFFLSVLGMGKR
jgi:glycosyltransferase involved in cell wall biosynthesis